LRRDGKRLWIIDPIDGSRGFAKKLGEFSIMIALVVDGAPKVGVVSEPARGRTTWAVRGQGCWRGDDASAQEQCRVSSASTWNQATMARSHSEKNSAKPDVSAVKRQLFTYSAGIKLALIARGEADVYLSTYLGFNPWDVCAGQLLVEEAGGRVTDLRGNAVRYSPDGSGKIAGTVASNSALHEQAIRLFAT
jgi:fructose-1,6-bisphosphatase/inositol monophosphatase family enzyme